MSRPRNIRVGALILRDPQLNGDRTAVEAGNGIHDDIALGVIRGQLMPEPLQGAGGGPGRREIRAQCGRLVEHGRQHGLAIGGDIRAPQPSDLERGNHRPGMGAVREPAAEQAFGHDERRRVGLASISLEETLQQRLGE